MTVTCEIKKFCNIATRITNWDKLQTEYLNHCFAKTASDNYERSIPPCTARSKEAGSGLQTSCPPPHYHSMQSVSPKSSSLSQLLTDSGLDAHRFMYASVFQCSFYQFWSRFLMPQRTAKLKLQCKIKSNATQSKQTCCEVLASEVFGWNYESTCEGKKWTKQLCTERKVFKLCFMGLQYTASTKSEVLKGHWVIQAKTKKQTRINGPGNPSSKPS